MLRGIGNLTGPAPDTQFHKVIELIKTCLPHFAKFVKNMGIDNEDGLNNQLSIFINNTAHNNKLPFFVERESMEDETYGNSPKTDFGVYLYAEDTSSPPPKITVFEGKRLNEKLGKRKREYVFGHTEKGKHISCGGIERFKLLIHGKNSNHAGLIGYIQDKTSGFWVGEVNSWISELSEEQHRNPGWSQKEHLIQFQSLEQGTIVTEYKSTVYRNNGNLSLTHLWVDLVGI